MTGPDIFKTEEKIIIPPKPEGLADEGNGVHSFLYDGKLLDEVKKYYRRENENVKIKILKQPLTGNLENHLWGPSLSKGSFLKEALTIQNIFSLYGLAPRVYAMFEIHDGETRHAAFLTEYLGEMGDYPHDNSELISRLNTVAEGKGIEIFDDGRGTNVVGNKYIDFQGFKLTSEYKESLKKRVTGIASVGRWGPWQNYQKINHLGIEGGRDMEHRIKNLGLEELDFTGKTVLDIGCSEGMFCQYVSDHGARKVVGVDLPDVVIASGELAYYLGYFNIDFVGADLKKDSVEHLGKFDIVLFLSMCHHIGYPEYLSRITNQILIFEGNAKNDDLEVENRIRKDFRLCNHKGYTTDLFKRPVIWGEV